MKKFIVLAACALVSFSVLSKTVIVLEINSSQTTQQDYILPRSAWFKLPTTLSSNSLVPANTEVKIAYNIFDDMYEFHCLYKTRNRSKVLTFQKCESQEGHLIIDQASDLQSMEFPMDQDSFIRLELVNPGAVKGKIKATYQVDWK